MVVSDSHSQVTW